MNNMLKKVCFIAALFMPCMVFAAGFSFNDPLNTNKLIKSPAPDTSSCSNLKKSGASLGLIDLINLALCNNPDTQKAWANVLSASADVGNSRAGYLPRINGVASVTRDRTTGNNSFNSNNGDWQSNFTPGISLNYLLYDFGQREANVKATEKNLNSVDYDYSSVMQGTIFSTLQAFYNFAAAKAAVDAAREVEKSSKASMDAAALRYKIGAGPLVDKLQAETAYSDAKLKRVQAENQQAISQAALMNEVGLEANAKVNVVVPPVNPHYDSALKNTIDEMIEYAKQNRPDLLSSQAKMESQKAKVDTIRAQGYPSISGLASTEYDDVISGSNDNHRNDQIGVSLSFPLFTGFSNTYQIKSAEGSYKAQIANYEKTKYAVTFDVWQSYQNFATATQNLSMTSDLLESASEAEKVAMGRYKNGVGSLIDLLNAQSQLASARQQRVQAIYNWFINKADLLRALGNINAKQVGDSVR